SYNALGVIRTTENLEAARTELKRILDEDIPKMTVSNHTRTYNRDWKDAIETINILELARLSVEETYIRPESRGNFYRPDYPEQNDTDWKCMLALYDAGNGEFAYDKVTYPDVAFPA
ncbi:MAG: FAD-binding protein, partial [Raoultibacter sp.]